MLSIEGCRTRQARLRTLMEKEELDIAIIRSPFLVYYFSGSLLEKQHPSILILGRDRESVLIASQTPARTAAQICRVYESYSIQRVISIQTVQTEAAAMLAQELNAMAKVERIGLDHGADRPVWEAVVRTWPNATLVEITPQLLEMRRRKDPDEIACIQATIALVEAGYQAVRAQFVPGLAEWEVFNTFQAAVVQTAGTAVPLQGDFAVGRRARQGGKPSSCQIAPGDLFILDIFPKYNGYYADLCRTFAASQPTRLQLKAWSVVNEALAEAESSIRPGTPAATIWRKCLARLDDFEPARGSFDHHAGHGIGLEEQEQPWLIPGSNQILEAGEVLAIEPGLYDDALQGGIRLENLYQVTEQGCECLSRFPLEL